MSSWSPRKASRLLGWILCVATVLFLTSGAHAQSPSTPSPGALIRMDMNTTVGVQLDDIPSGPQRETAAAWALSQGQDFWVKRATTQTNLTFYRLVFRSFYYTPPPARGACPLPPRAVWKLELLDEPHRTQIGTHDYVAVKY